jgi:acyl carrier protein
LMTLSEEFGIDLDTRDATPKNLQNLDSICRLIEKKLAEKENK